MIYATNPPFKNNSVVVCSNGNGGVADTDFIKFIKSLTNPSIENTKINKNK